MVMPFYKRTIEPQNLCRLKTGPLQSSTGFQFMRCSGFGSQLWTSLHDVRCKSLQNILQQLSDLSRHASSIFLEIQNEAASVIQRTAALQKRLDTLQQTVRQLNHKKIHIPFIFNDEDEG